MSSPGEAFCIFGEYIQCVLYTVNTPEYEVIKEGDGFAEGTYFDLYVTCGSALLAVAQ